MKKFVLTLLILSVFLPLTACEDSRAEKTLICDENGDFTILVVSDPQCDNSEQWQEAKAELETLIKRSDPDFVVINGDMNSENKIPAYMWDDFISPLTERGIYWSTTNGNHDPFSEEHYQMYKSYDKCLNSKVLSGSPYFEAGRPMNYVNYIYPNNGDVPVFAIYAMDSGTSNENGYEGVTEKQIAWYESESEALKKLNRGKAVTSVLCMHIPLPQTVDMYYGNENGTKVYGIINETDGGMKNYVCENETVVSDTHLRTTTPENDNGMFEKILKNGDIKAAIFGHIHRTNIIGSYKGVLLGFAGKLSSGCYSDTLCRGGRVIKFNQSAPEKFTVSWLSSLETGEDQPAIYFDGSISS